MADETDDKPGSARPLGSQDENDDERESRRGADISKRKRVKEELLKTYEAIKTGYRDQWERSNDQLEFWEIYNCILTAKQFYNGDSRIFVPIIHNAVNARKTRFTNQIFPVAGRYVEVTASDDTKPDALASLLEYYVRRAKLRTKIMPALCKAGDVEGQYNLYVSWCKRTRHVTYKVETQPEISDGLPNPAVEPMQDVREEEIEAAHPDVEVINDSDILVLPQTADSIEEAIEDGGSVTIIRRWGKAKIRRMIREGAIRKDEGEALIDRMGKKSPPEDVNTEKRMVDNAGIKGGEGKRYGLVYETYTNVEIKKDERRLCQVFYGGDDCILGARRNPLWCDKVPLLSASVEKVANVFKGRSKIADCADLQYYANDSINEAADSGILGLMPVIMTDPEKNPRVGSMVLSKAAVWETSPKDTSVLQFPPMWEKGFEIVNACKAEVAQTLSVSPAAITGGGGTRKPNQAQVAQEQQVDILTTADAVTVIEEGILTPLLNLFIELDHQYRDDEITVRAFGEMGLKAKMEQIPPVQMDRRYQFRWLGVEAARNAQQIQQQIAGMNVIRGIPPQQLNGYQVNLVPIINQLIENTFGPRLAPLIFLKPEEQMPVPVEQENMLLGEGFEVPTHQMDDDQQHIQAHMAEMQRLQMGGVQKQNKKFQVHVWKHMQQMQQKQQQQQAAQQQQGAPGVPGGAGPGVAGTPRIGAQPGVPRPQGPPGMIHPDAMRDPRMMPRRAG